MRENLIPTARTDKNGRTVIRHMRPETHSQSAKDTLPAPALSGTAHQQDATLEELFSLIKAMIETDENRHGFDSETRRALNSYPESFRNELRHYLMDLDNDTAAVIARKVATGHSDHVDLCEYAYFLPRINMADKDHAVVLLNTVREYMNDGIIAAAWDYSKADERIKLQCLALMNTAAAIEETGRGNNWTSMSFHSLVMQVKLARLTDNDLIVRLVTRPHEAEDIIKVIKEHGVTDYRTIRGILDGIAPSLSSGAL